MMSRTPASPDTIDRPVVARGVLRKLPLLLTIAGAVGAAAVGVLSTMAPQYLSQTQLEIRGAGPSDTGGRPDKEAVGTHVRGLMSTELALKMSKELQLTQRPEFNSALEPNDLYGRLWRMIGVGGPKAGETDEDRLMQAYFKAVRAYQVRDTRSVIVDCTSPNAKFAADCANKLAELYRDSLSGRAVVENTDVRGKLAPQVERLTRETAEAEAQVTEFRGKANLFQGGTQATQLKDQQLSDLTAELTRVATARGEADARAASAREMSARGIAAANPDVQKSLLIPRMEEQRVTLERQIAELSATLLPGHPRMKQLASELAGLQGQIRAEVVKVVESLANDARIAAERESGTRRRIEDMKRTVVSSAPDSAKLAQLDNQAKAKRAELERVQRQYETASSTAGAGVAPTEVEIVSRAYPSNEKVFPKTGSMAALAALATFILGLALVLTRELVRGARPQAIITEADVRGVRAAEPTLASRAAVAHPPTLSAEAVTASSVLDPAHAAAQLMRLAGETRGFRVLIAGDGDTGDGAMAAVALCRSLGGEGRHTLLLAWSGSGDTIANCTGLAASPGTAQLVTGTASLEAAIQRMPGGTVDVVTAGDGAAPPIDADSAAMVLDALDEIYDFIVVHGTPKVAADLFKAVQGRFDAGVLVAEAAPATTTAGASPSFLGFNVPDFPVMIVAETSASVVSPSRPGTLPRRTRAAALA